MGQRISNREELNHSTFRQVSRETAVGWICAAMLLIAGVCIPLPLVQAQSRQQISLGRHCNSCQVSCCNHCSVVRHCHRCTDHAPSCDCAAGPKTQDGVPRPPVDSDSMPDVSPDSPISPDQPLFDTSDLAADSFGTGFGYESAAPNLIGDFFGGSSQRITFRNTVPFAFHVNGFIAAGSPGNPNSLIIYEAGAGTPNDFTSTGIGIDTTGDLMPDTFQITEPLPPNDSPTSPGPGYVFDGGTAVYTDSIALTTAQDGQFGDGEVWYASYSYSQTFEIDVPGGGGAVVRRIKLAENNSPIPRDRLFGLYNFFSNVPAGYGDVNRFAFGFEKTFWQGGMSMDVRFPFAGTLAADQIADAAGSKDAEFGNMTLTWKTLLHEEADLLWSGGLGVSLPTAADTRLFRAAGQQVLQIDNEALHLMPFLAVLSTPNDRAFLQAFFQLDFDVNGNPISVDPAGANLQSIGRLQDATLLFMDLTVGYWAYRNPYADLITAVAPVVELHYSSTVQDTESLTGNGFTVNSLTRRFDVLNMTVGTHLYLGDRFTVTPALAFPLRTGDDQQFDMEGIVQANWYF